MSQEKKAIPEVQHAILRQLHESKVNGFPFIAYAGIRDYEIITADSLMLLLPKNPKNLKCVLISYDGAGLYYLVFYDTDMLRKHVEAVPLGALAPVIAYEMGIL